MKQIELSLVRIKDYNDRLVDIFEDFSDTKETMDKLNILINELHTEPPEVRIAVVSGVVFRELMDEFWNKVREAK